MLNPGNLLPPTFGPGANLLQSFEVWQQGALGSAGGNMLADMGDSVWDEAVNQLLEALVPQQGLGRGLNRLGGPAMPGQAAGRAGAPGGDDAGLDPREWLQGLAVWRQRVRGRQASMLYGVCAE
jgi:hypothetical protein